MKHKSNCKDASMNQESWIHFRLYRATSPSSVRGQNRCLGTAPHTRVVFYSLLDISCINSKKILLRLKKLRHWKMCWFQRISHWIFMIRTSRASDFLIFTSPLDLHDAILLLRLCVNKQNCDRLFRLKTNFSWKLYKTSGFFEKNIRTEIKKWLLFTF